MPNINTTIDLDIGPLQRILEEFGGTLENLASAFQQMTEEQREQQERMKQYAKGADDAVKHLGKTWISEHDGMEKKVKDLDERYDDFLKKLKERGGIGEQLSHGVPQQLMGVRSGFDKFRSSILSEIPFGGLIGLMVLGGKREPEVRAMTTEAMRNFQQAGQVGRGEVSQMQDRIRALGVQLGKGPMGLQGELAAASASFGQLGVDADEVLQKSFMQNIGRANESILETSMRLDSLFKQGAGTSARQMATLMRDFSMSADESSKTIAAVGLRARESGTSVTAFTTSIMRSSAALRTQRINIGEVADAQLKFQRVIQQIPGTTQQYSAQFAERAIQQVTQGMAGMSVGLAAVLGERITARRPELGEGEALTGLEARRQMMLGFQGRIPEGEQGVFQETLQELINLAKEAAPDEAGQRFFLEKMGFGFEGAEAIMGLSDSIEEGNSLNDAIKNNQKDLNRAFIDREQETSKFQRALLKIQDGIAKTGAGLLGTTISGFEMISTLLRMGLDWMMGGINDINMETYERMLASQARKATRAVDYTMEGLEQSGIGGLDFLKGVMGHGGDTSSWEQARAATIKRRGGVDVGGAAVQKKDLESLKKRADREMRMRSVMELESSLRGSHVPEEMRRELMGLYRTKGAGAVRERIEQEGGMMKFQSKRGGRGVIGAGIAEDIEASVSRSKMNIEGQEVELRVVSRVEAVRVKNKNKGVDEGAGRGGM